MKTTFFRLALRRCSVAVRRRMHRTITRRQVESASERSVQFSYRVRPGVMRCGRTYISTGSGNLYGAFSTNGPSSVWPAGAVVRIWPIGDNALRTCFVCPGGGSEPGVAIGVVTSRTRPTTWRRGARAMAEWARAIFARFSRRT